MRQNVLSVYLVVQQVEAVSRFVLRLAIQLDLKFPNVTRCCQTHRQSPHLSSFTSTPEVRVLSSAGVTRPQWSYDPLRLPDWPSPLRTTLGGATSTSPGYPPLTQITFSACRAHYPGGSEQVLVGSFPARAAFPVLPAGRHPHRHCRGLLKLHTRYGLHSCSPTRRGLYREAPPAPVSRLGRSQAIQSYQQLLEWVLPPLVICAFGAHGRSRWKPYSGHGSPGRFARSGRVAGGGGSGICSRSFRRCRCRASGV